MRNKQHHGNPQTSNNQHRYSAPSERDRSRYGQQQRNQETSTGNWGSSDSDGQFDEERPMPRGGRDSRMDLAQEGMSRSDRELDRGRRAGGERGQGWTEDDRSMDGRRGGFSHTNPAHDDMDDEFGMGGEEYSGSSRRWDGKGSDGYDSGRSTGAMSGRGAASPNDKDRTSGPHSGKGPKGYQRSDERIQEEVSEELARHGGLDASEVEIAVKGGEVTLNGTVPERAMKRMAEDCVENCSGVKHVQNNIRVAEQGGSSNGRSASQDHAADESMQDGSAGSTRQGKNGSSKGNGSDMRSHAPRN